MKKEDFVKDLVDAFAVFNNTRSFWSFQLYLKGENFLLTHLYENGGSDTPGHLAQVLSVSAARIAAILRSLERKKLIERDNDGIDKRKVVVRITEKGTEWVKIAKDEMVKHALGVFDRLGERDTEELVRILNKITKGDSQTKNTSNAAEQKSDGLHGENNERGDRVETQDK